MGAGFARLLVVLLVLVVGREARFAFIVAEGRIGLCALCLYREGRVGLCALRGLSGEAGVMARHTPVRGSCRKPSP